ERPRLAPAILFGFAIGVVGGALGVILGTLRVPALLRGVGLSAREAVGTNLVVGFALGVFGLVAHAARLEVEWSLLAVGVPGGLSGAWLGARLPARMSQLALRRALGGALPASAARVPLAPFVSASRRRSGKMSRRSRTTWRP